jgi:hypothetical protein
MKRRDFITLLAGAAWPLAARAQRRARHVRAIIRCREKNPKLTFSGCFCANPRIPAKRVGGEIVAFSPDGLAVVSLQLLQRHSTLDLGSDETRLLKSVS